MFSMRIYIAERLENIPIVNLWPECIDIEHGAWLRQEDSSLIVQMKSLGWLFVYRKLHLRFKFVYMKIHGPQSGPIQLFLTIPYDNIYEPTLVDIKLDERCRPTGPLVLKLWLETNWMSLGSIPLSSFQI